MYTGAQLSPFAFTFSGSFNGNENLDQINPNDFAESSRNFNTHNGGVEKRGGTTLVYSLISGNPRCLGIGQMLALGGGTSYLYYVGANGTIYRNNVALTGAGTGLSTSAKRVLTATPGKMFICSGLESVKVDTGSAIANIATPPADWTGTTHPTQIVIHSRNASHRAFAIGVSNKATTIYYSALNSFEDFTSAGSGTLTADVADGAGIVAAVSMDENLFLFGRYETFIVDDSSTTVSNWGTYRASWQGGAYGPRLVIKARNNIYAMMEDGDIYCINRAEQLRDYDRASISRPFFIHNWIRKNVDLTKIADFHMAYDPQIDAIKIWVTRVGQSTPDTALVYYLPNDLYPNGKWASPHDAQDNPTNSGYAASASCTARVSTGEWRCVTGDFNGGTWYLEKTSKSDNGNRYKTIVDKPWMDCGYPHLNKLFSVIRLNYISRGAYTISVLPIIDNSNQVVSTLTLQASGSGLGSFVLNTDVLGVLGVNQGVPSIDNIGRLIRFQIFNSGAGEDFFLSQALLEFKEQGSAAYA